jgi:hypothetical protein
MVPEVDDRIVRPLRQNMPFFSYLKSDKVSKSIICCP